MKVSLRNRLTGLNITNYNTADILSYLPFFFYFKSTVEEFGLQFICGNINI